MRTEEDILLEKVANNPVGVSDALLPAGSDLAKKVLLEGLDGGSELDALVALTILDKIKFDSKRNVYTNEYDLEQNPNSKLGIPYDRLMANAVAQGIFKIGIGGKVSLSDSAKTALVEMQKRMDSRLRY